MKYYLILSLVTKLNYAKVTSNPLPGVRFGYCDTDSSVCDMCGTVTQPPRYKFDIFNEDSEKISSFTPRDAPYTARIFGGRQVAIGEVPWQANLLYPSKYYSSYNVRIGRQSYYEFCGGVIVSNTKVITAAHCILSTKYGSFKSNDKIKVIAGHSSIRTARQISGLEKYVLHP